MKRIKAISKVSNHSKTLKWNDWNEKKVPYPFLIKTGKIIKIVFVVQNMQN
jgi:hypothetical protein